MTQFIQLHILTSYPPANLNRDDLGRPKTARMGGVERLRISSQSLKRAWRTSDIFTDALGNHRGTRTRMLGEIIRQKLVDNGVKEKDAYEWAKDIAGQFAKVKEVATSDTDSDGTDKKKKRLETEQLAHISPEEITAIHVLIDRLAQDNRAPEKDELQLLRNDHKAVDIAMFGRMMAAMPVYNCEAAVQVAHAITVHPVSIEDDFFSAVDDLNTHDVDAGAGHIGEAAFAAGLFYLYVCINKDLLQENLQNDAALTAKALRALTEAVLKVAPAGKQNSYASRAYASYVLAEKGNQQPRSLSVAYLKPIQHTDDYATKAIAALQDHCTSIDTIYGQCANDRLTMNAFATDSATAQQLLDFVAQH